MWQCTSSSIDLRRAVLFQHAQTKSILVSGSHRDLELYGTSHTRQRTEQVLLDLLLANIQPASVARSIDLTAIPTRKTYSLKQHPRISRGSAHGHCCSKDLTQFNETQTMSGECKPFKNGGHILLRGKMLCFLVIILPPCLAEGPCFKFLHLPIISCKRWN